MLDAGVDLVNHEMDVMLPQAHRPAFFPYAIVSYHQVAHLI